MGKIAVYKYMTLMCLVIQIVLTVFTFVGLFGGNVTPAGNTARAMLVYVLPLLIAANIVMLVVWLIKRNWLVAAVPLVTVLCCIPYIGTVWQPRPLSADPYEGRTLTVATYNVAKFGNETSGFMAQDILSEMKKQAVDVLCFQEYSDLYGGKRNSDNYKDYFPYMRTGNDDMVIYSRYPITSSENMPFEDSNNSAMWCDIDVKGSIVRVYNAHLETTGFNRTIRQAAKSVRSGYSVESNALLRAVYSNYTLGMTIRAGQADALANEMRACTLPLIVCGDFNDVPYSYVYNTVLDGLIDGFKECGSGWMRTYRGKKPVRIDYVFHSETLTGLSYYFLPLTYSDHYPVVFKAAFK